MIVAKKYSFDNKCPDACVGKDGNGYQGDICCRCPVFNCSGQYPLLQPDDYREDWAKDFHEWIYNGGPFPALCF